MRAEESGEPVVVPAAVFEGLEAVRLSGANMVDRAHVLVVAYNMGYRQTVLWAEEHPHEYSRGIFQGFTAEE